MCLKIGNRKNRRVRIICCTFFVVSCGSAVHFFRLFPLYWFMILSLMISWTSLLAALTDGRGNSRCLPGACLFHARTDRPEPIF